MLRVRVQQACIPVQDFCHKQRRRCYAISANDVPAFGHVSARVAVYWAPFAGIAGSRGRG